VDANLREGEHDEPDRNPGGPQQIRVRHNERSDRQQDRESQPC
jgi:hypothetical protein